MEWAIALCTLVPLLIHLSLGRRRPNLVDETQAKTTLHILDDNIVEYMTNPNPNTGENLFRDIQEYNKHFEEIIDGFKERKFRFVRIAHVIYDKGGPNFMKLRINAPIFLKVNAWTMNEMGELYHYLKITNRLWLEFKNIYNEVKTAVKGNWTQLKSTFQSTIAPNTRWNLTALFQSIAEVPELSRVQVTGVPMMNETSEHSVL